MVDELVLYIHEERIACRDCLPDEGEELFGLVPGAASALVRIIGTNRGKMYSRIDDTSLQELAVLLASTKHFTLQCAGGHIEYDLRARQLVVLPQTATSTAGTATS